MPLQRTVLSHKAQPCPGLGVTDRSNIFLVLLDAINIIYIFQRY